MEKVFRKEDLSKRAKISPKIRQSVSVVADPFENAQKQRKFGHFRERCAGKQEAARLGSREPKNGIRTQADYDASAQQHSTFFMGIVSCDRSIVFQAFLRSSFRQRRLRARQNADARLFFLRRQNGAGQNRTVRLCEK
jgi:hypothetical protein